MTFPKIWIICRVCLKQQEDMFNLFDDTLHNNIWTLLRDCSGLPVRKNDSLPDKICKVCLARLWKAMDFRIDCQRSYRELLQKQMESDALLYEAGNNDEILKTSDIPRFKEEQQICTYLEEDNDNTLAEATNTDKSTADNSNITSLEMKQYCVITRIANEETNPESDNELRSKQPIVLLLRLKNPSNGSFQNETNDLEKLKIKTNKQTAPKLKKRRKTLTETINNMTVINNDNIHLDNKKGKAESKTSIKIKPKLSKRKADFPCSICKKVYKTNELLRHHSYIHKKPYECNQGQSLLSHNNQHTGIKPYYCRICFETFSDISNRNGHERRHNKQQYKCNSCNKSFRFLALLQKHSSSHKPKKCLICNKDFASVRMVRIHHRRKHLKCLDL